MPILKTDKKTQDHLTNQGIKTDLDLKAAVIKLTKESKDQTRLIVSIYAMFFSEWNDIKTIKGWPAIGKELSSFLFEACMRFDREKHPDVFAGGRWFNSGFSTDEKLGPWEIDMSRCEIILNNSNIESTAPVVNTVEHFKKEQEAVIKEIKGK